MLDLNIYAIVVSAVIIMVLGAFWFSPVLFGNAWMAAMGLTMNDIEEMQKEGKSMGSAYAASMISAVTIAVAFAVLIRLLGLEGNVVYGLLLAVGIYFCFNFTTVIKQIFWEERPAKLVFISGGYELTSFIFAGAIISVWQ